MLQLKTSKKKAPSKGRFIRKEQQKKGIKSHPDLCPLSVAHSTNSPQRSSGKEEWLGVGKTTKEENTERRKIRGRNRSGGTTAVNEEGLSFTFYLGS